MKKYIFPLFLIFCIIISSFFALSASAYEITGVDIRSDAALLASYDTKEIIYSKNADKKMYPASLTKIMTALVVLRETEDLDAEKITVSADALRLISGTGSTVSGLLEGEIISAREALSCLLITSGGDVAYAIAEHYGGTTEGFVEKMNALASELKMTGTHFANPHGLHDDNHYTTANDLLKVTLAAMEYDSFNQIVSVTRYKMPATNLHDERLLVTTNFLQDPSTAYYYKYASGIKTGFTEKAGRCLVTTATKNGYTYICILLGSPWKIESGEGVRYEFPDSKNIYEWAFSNLEYKTALTDENAVCEIEVTNSFDTDHIALFPERDIAAILPKGADESTISVKAKPNSEKVKAPIEKGEVLGVAEIYYAGEKKGEVNLISNEEVKESNILTVLASIGRFFTSKFFKAFCVIILMIVVLFIMYVVYLNRKREKRKRRVVYKPYKNVGKHDKVSDDYRDFLNKY